MHERNTRKFKWKCKECGSIQTSDPLQRHTMDYCKCGKTGVDAEEYYTRIMGPYEYIGEVKDDNIS